MASAGRSRVFAQERPKVRGGGRAESRFRDGASRLVTASPRRFAAIGGELGTSLSLLLRWRMAPRQLLRAGAAAIWGSRGCWHAPPEPFRRQSRRLRRS